MARCCECGEEFNLSNVRRRINRKFGSGVYDSYYSDGDVCYDCALETISADDATGAELRELMGDSWDDD